MQMLDGALHVHPCGTCFSAYQNIGIHTVHFYPLSILFLGVGMYKSLFVDKYLGGVVMALNFAFLLITWALNKQLLIILNN